MVLKRILYNAIIASIFETAQASEDDEPCKLFNVECSVTDGFTITVNQGCKTEQYGHLGPDNKGLFVWGKDLEADGATDPTDDEIADNCRFNGDSVTFGFEECGKAGHSDGPEATTWKTFVHHRANVGPIITSSMDQAPIECKMDHVDLEVVPMGVADNDELKGIHTVGSPEMIEEFQLELKAGTVASGKFDPFVDGFKVDVGKLVRIKLVHRKDAKYQNKYQFVLRDCFATASNDVVSHILPIYTEYCPAVNSGVLGVDHLDTKMFDFNAFRVGDTDDLVITCKVVIYPETVDLTEDKYTCPAGVIGRRRREIAAVRRSVTEIEKRQDDPESVTTEGEVAVVIGLSNSDLEDLSERTITDSEGNPLTIYVAPEDEEKEGKEAIAATAAPAAASSSRICANVGLFFMILKI